MTSWIRGNSWSWNNGMRCMSLYSYSYQQFIQTNNKRHIKLRITGSLWEKLTCDWWILLTKASNAESILWRNHASNPIQRPVSIVYTENIRLWNKLDCEYSSVGLQGKFCWFSTCTREVVHRGPVVLNMQWSYCNIALKHRYVFDLAPLNYSTTDYRRSNLLWNWTVKRQQFPNRGEKRGTGST